MQMKNKYINYLGLIFLIFFSNNVYSQDQFNFNVKEIFITDNGNKFIGKNKGTVSSNTGLIIDADEFEYNKKLNLLTATGNVVAHDKINDYFIYSKKIIYDKEKEIILTKEKSKGVSLKDDLTIDADEFEYNKKLNLLTATGNVVAHDKINDYFIYSKKIIYDKEKEIILTKEKSKGVSLKDDLTIDADEFEYDLKASSISASNMVRLQDNKRNFKLSSNYVNYLVNQGQINTNGNSKIIDLNRNVQIFAKKFQYNIQKNVIKATNNVIYKNKKNNYEIFSDEITYLKNKNEIYSRGKTSANINSKYSIQTEDIIFFENEMEIISDNKTIIKDKNNIYETSNLKYYVEKEFFKGKNILVNSNYKTPQNDKYYFAHGMIDLKNYNFIAGDTKVKIHKNALDNPENDPRIIGKSSKKKGDITLVKKGIFTSCKENDNCPPWIIQASEIKHDQNKKEISYENAILKFYNVPIFYFPKFFHPDPTVKRRSGILKPVINDSNILGSSLTVPYFHILSEESDLTLTPSVFDNGSNLIQNEYRKVGKNSDLLINFGHSRNFQSSLQNKKKNISYVFSQFDFDLNLKNFETSKLDIKVEKVTNDSFLKIYDANLLENTTSLKPNSNDVMKSELKLTLNKDQYNLTTGFSSYENMQKNKNDRYQFVLPYYNFNKTIVPEFIDGSISLNSNGSNDLNNTNQVTTKITNNLSYTSNDFFTKNGIKNNFNINLRNLNSVGKNVKDYKSSPQIELSSLFEVNSSLPLKKENEKSISYLTPKISIRANPGDMKNHEKSNNTINTGNIFSIDRFGLGDTYEAGKSMTLGLNYKKETLDEMNKYFEMKLATVFRDKEENFIPSKTTLNKKTSNVFGSLSTNLIQNLNLKYDFAVNNNLDEIEYNDIGATIFFDNFSSTFNFIKEMNEMGDENFLKNTTTYKFDDQNFLTFNTRRNRKIDLTEFYNLVYEYKNDCLVAGVKYNKTYYEDKDLKPTENLMFTLTFVPLTSYEQKIDK